MVTKTETRCFFCNHVEGEKIPIPEPVRFFAPVKAVTHFECLQEAMKDVRDRDS